MDNAAMAVLARVVQECKTVRYHVKELKLDKMCPMDTQSRANCIRYGFAANSQQYPKHAASASSRRASLTVAESLAGWGCLDLTLLSSVPLSDAYALSIWERSASWPWIAFGLFYPRPKRFARAFKLCSSSQLNLHRDFVEKAVKTLRSPAAELVYSGKCGEDNPMVAQPADALMVCTVKNGAVIDSFNATLEPSWPQTDTLRERSELEDL